MKKQIFGLLFLLLLVIGVSAQKKGAYIFSGFDSLWHSESLREFDGFLMELQKNPAAKGIVIFYEGKYAQNPDKENMLFPNYGETSCRVEAVRYHALSRRRFPAERISFFNGGIRQEQTIEFWIVPENAEPPKATPTFDLIKYRKEKHICKEYKELY